MATLEEMVERVAWMSPIDYEILLFFEEHDILASPKVISANIKYDRQYTSKRCRELLKSGILEKSDEYGLYHLSELGKEFLTGEMDADDLPDPSED